MANTRQKNPTIRISAKTHETVKQLAEENKTSMADVVAEAVERFRRERILKHANEVWAEAMKDPEERAFWEKEDRDIELTFWAPIDDPWDEEIKVDECPKREE